jgi:hypothetical protein
VLNTLTPQLIKLQQPSPPELTTIVRGASAQRNRDNLWAEFGYVIQIISIPQQQQRVIFQPLSKDRYLQVFTYPF